MYKIEKNKKLPEDPRGAKRKYPFHILKIGESFFAQKPSTNITSSYNYYKRNHDQKNKQFTCRTVVENNKNGTRCWRIK